MIGNILVGITLKLLGAGATSAGLEEVDIASRRAAVSLALAKKEITSLDAAMARNALTNESIALRQQRIMTQTAQHAMRTRAMISGAFALGGAAAIIAGIRQAAQFEQAMVSVKIATGASADEMARFQKLVMNTSGVTAQSSVTIASELAAAAASGLNNPARLRAAFPQMARAADVLMLGPKHIDPVDSITQLSKLSHLFGAYSGTPLHNMVDAAVRMMYVQPDSLSKLVNQGKYFIPTALAAGVSMKDILFEGMSMGQLGLMSGRGGTSLKSYIQYMLGSPSLTEFRTRKQRDAFIALGLYDQQGRNRFITSGGDLELEQSIAWLAHKRKTMKPDEFVSEVYKAFLQQGAQYIIPRTAGYAMAQAGQNAIALNRIAPPGQAVEVMWKLYMHTTIGAWRLFVTNFSNLAQAVFLPLLPPITTGLTALAGVLRGWADFFMSNKAAAWSAALLAITAVAASALYATANLWALNRALLATGSAAGGKSITAGGVLIKWLPLLGRISFYAAAAYFTLQAIHDFWRFGHDPSYHKNVVRHNYNAGEGYAAQSMSWPDYYRYVTGQYYGVPTVGSRAQLRNLIREGSYSGLSGGDSFNDYRLRRALKDHLSMPLVNALLGGSGSVTQTQRESTDKTVEAIHAQTSAIVSALSRVGITINVPGQPAQHQKLFGPHGPTPATAGGFAVHPTKSTRTGVNHKP